jgi:hypothetical protein
MWMSDLGPSALLTWVRTGAGRSRSLAVGCAAVLSLATCATTIGAGSDAAAATRAPATSRSLATLPAAASGPISADLGADDSQYRVVGRTAHNPVQGLSASFGRSGVTVSGGGAPATITLRAFGRGAGLQPVADSRIPLVEGNRVDYEHRSLSEWWANGPLGLEQGFEIAQRPSGSGALTIELHISGVTSLRDGVVAIGRDLRYSGLSARDAAGRPLAAGFSLHAGELLIRVDDDDARYPVRIDPFVQRATLSVSDAVPGDQFGYSVAVSGDTVVVGAPSFGDVYEDQGAAYVFQAPSSHWGEATQVAELTASNAEEDAQLGYSVAISDSLVVAGAPGQNAAYVFEEPADGWSGPQTQSAELTGGTGHLGFSVAIDQNTSVAVSVAEVAVGAPGANGGDGAVYVYVQQEIEDGSVWPSAPSAVLTANDATGDDQLGWSVAFSGNLVVAGAPTHNVGSNAEEGAVYVFYEPSGGWSNSVTQGDVLDPTSAGADGLVGWSVAISGNLVVAGAPFETENGNATQGALYEFSEAEYRGKPLWVVPDYSLTINPPNGGGANAQLGRAVAIEDDTVVGGSLNEGTYVFVPPSSGWPSGLDYDSAYLGPQSNSEDGAANDWLAIGGDVVVAGAPGAKVSMLGEIGEAVVFVRPDPTISITAPRDTTYGDGADVAAAYSCAPPSGASTISCTGPVAEGAAIDTSPGSYTFTVQAEDSDGAVVTKTVDYTVVAPSVTAVSPSAGPTAGGNTVTITGTGFAAGDTVDFGTSASSKVSYVSLDAVKAVAPAGSSGTVDITVTSPDGTETSPTSSADEYTYDPAPSVTGVDPPKGEGAGQNTVTIDGTGFLPGSSVLFGTVASSSVTYESATELEAVAPAHASGAVNVFVETPGGKSATSSADVYDYLPPPSVSAVSPSAGPTAGGNTVTITGTGFAAGDTVDFGTSASSKVSYVSLDELRAVAPAGSSGTVDITVTSPDGTETSPTSPADAYTYDPAPSVTGVDPTSGPEAGQNTVTIDGAGFLPGSSVLFGSVASSSVTYESATELEAVAPAHASGAVNVFVETPGGKSATSSADVYHYLSSAAFAAGFGILVRARTSSGALARIILSTFATLDALAARWWL